MPGVSAAGQLVERVAHVLLERRRREAFGQRSREVERAQLGEIEARVVETAEGALLELPVALALVHFVEERKARLLERLEIAPDGPGRDARASRPYRRSSGCGTIRGRAGATTAG